jgi:hypothetical protein
MSQILTPDQIMQQQRAIELRIEKGIIYVNKLEEELDKLKREYEWAKARVMLTAEGSVETKKAQADLETQAERTAYEVARAAFGLAKQQLDRLGQQNIMLSSHLKAVMALYMSAGRE